MKIGLIDVDGHNFPNLPLMKISAHHKQLGDDIEWYDPMFGGDTKCALIEYATKLYKAGYRENSRIAEEIKASMAYKRALENALHELIKWECPDLSDAEQRGTMDADLEKVFLQALKELTIAERRVEDNK